MDISDLTPEAAVAQSHNLNRFIISLPFEQQKRAADDCVEAVWVEDR